MDEGSRQTTASAGGFEVMAVGLLLLLLLAGLLA